MTAKRWTVSEAIKALREGNKEARIDIARRFPLFATATDEEILDEIDIMTVRQVEARMKGQIDVKEVEEENEIEEKEIKKKKVEKKTRKKKVEKIAEPEDDIIEDDFEDLFADEEE